MQIPTRSMFRRLMVGRISRPFLLALLGLSLTLPSDRAGALGEDPNEGGLLTSIDLRHLGMRQAGLNQWQDAKVSSLSATLMASDPALAGLAYHNLAMASLELGEVAAAREFFIDSMASRTGNRDTQHDLEWTLRLIGEDGPPRAPAAEKTPRRNVADDGGPGLTEPTRPPTPSVPESHSPERSQEVPEPGPSSPGALGPEPADGDELHSAR